MAFAASRRVACLLLLTAYNRRRASLCRLPLPSCFLLQPPDFLFARARYSPYIVITTTQGLPP